MTACSCPTCGAPIGRDHFSFDAESGLVVAGGTFVHLVRRETQILEVLLDRRGRSVSKSFLFREVYRLEDEPENETVIESHVSKLRKKLLPLGLVISSERFRGYQLNMEANRE